MRFGPDEPADQEAVRAGKRAVAGRGELAVGRSRKEERSGVRRGKQLTDEEGKGNAGSGTRKRVLGDWARDTEEWREVSVSQRFCGSEKFPKRAGQRGRTRVANGRRQSGTKAKGGGGVVEAGTRTLKARRRKSGS